MSARMETIRVLMNEEDGNSYSFGLDSIHKGHLEIRRYNEDGKQVDSLSFPPELLPQFIAALDGLRKESAV